VSFIVINIVLSNAAIRCLMGLGWTRGAVYPQLCMTLKFEHDFNCLLIAFEWTVSSKKSK
jgi:hypothetical protein